MSSLRSFACAALLTAAGLLLAQQTALGQADPKLKGTASVSGQVSVGGKPAAGIVIAAFAIETGRARIPVAQSVTDAEGHYRLGALPPGQFQVASLAPNLPTTETSDPSFSVMYGPSKTIILAAGEEVDSVDLKLTRGAVITGRVTDAENKPVVDERVSLQVISDSGRTPVRVPYFTYVTQMNATDDRGIYRIYGLPAGRYKVSVGSAAGEGNVTSIRGYFQRTYYPDATDASRAEIVDLSEGGEATNIDIRLGRREDTFKVSGQVVDETGTLVNNVRVGFMVAPKERDRFSPMVGQPTVDGAFRLEGLAPGRYAAYVASDFGTTDFYSEPVFFEVVDKDVTGVEIRATRGLTVSGIVAAENMDIKQLLRQLPNLRVSVNVQPAGGRIEDPSQRSGGTAAIMPDGSFEVKGLRAGRANIGVFGIDAFTRPSIISIEHAGVGITQGFEIQPGQSISDMRLVLTYGTGVIRGSVKFEGGTPPDNLRSFVSCMREGTHFSGGGAQLDARGHFILRGLAPGRYEVTLQTFGPSAPGQRPSPQKQTVMVTNEIEAEANFVVDLSQKAGGP